MLFSSGKNEYRMCRRFLKSLQESVERRLRQHMYLVDDIHTVFSYLRRNTHLIHQSLDVIYTVVGCRVKLMDAV